MRVLVNGIEIYYEAEGSGPPIILLHGNGEDHRIFDRLVDDLKNEYTVYSLDTRGHGQSGKVDSFHYADMVNDVAAFIQELKLNRPLLYGFSDGGIVGLMLASEHPEMLSGLIASGVNLTPNDLKGWFRTMIKMQNFFRKDPMLKLMLDEPNITGNDLKKIEIPVLITVAKKDIVSISHAEYIAEKIRNCKLLVIPEEDHGSYVIHSEKLFPLISDFLKEVK